MHVTGSVLEDGLQARQTQVCHLIHVGVNMHDKGSANPHIHMPLLHYHDNYYWSSIKTYSWNPDQHCKTNFSNAIKTCLNICTCLQYYKSIRQATCFKSEVRGEQGHAPYRNICSIKTSLTAVTCYRVNRTVTKIR